MKTRLFLLLLLVSFSSWSLMEMSARAEFNASGNLVAEAYKKLGDKVKSSGNLHQKIVNEIKNDPKLLEEWKKNHEGKDPTEEDVSKAWDGEKDAEKKEDEESEEASFGVEPQDSDKKQLPNEEELRKYIESLSKQGEDKCLEGVNKFLDKAFKDGGPFKDYEGIISTDQAREKLAKYGYQELNLKDPVDQQKILNPQDYDMRFIYYKNGAHVEVYKNGQWISDHLQSASTYDFAPDDIRGGMVFRLVNKNIPNQFR